MKAPVGAARLAAQDSKEGTGITSVQVGIVVQRRCRERPGAGERLGEGRMA